MILKNLAGLLIFSTGIIWMFLTVPWEEIKKRIMTGVISGLILALLLIHLMQNTFNCWIFYQVDFVYIFKIPFFLSASWIPIVIIYSHLLTQYKDLPLIIAALISFPAGATIVQFLLIANQMLIYHRWNLTLTFLLSVGIHLGITYYLYLTGHLNNLLPKSRK